MGAASQSGEVALLRELLGGDGAWHRGLSFYKGGPPSPGHPTPMALAGLCLQDLSQWHQGAWRAGTMALHHAPSPGCPAALSPPVTSCDCPEGVGRGWMSWLAVAADSVPWW